LLALAIDSRGPRFCRAFDKNRFPVAMGEGKHPVPSRTRQLSPPPPMVLPGRPGGRVGRRRELFPAHRAGSEATLPPERGFAASCLAHFARGSSPGQRVSFATPWPRNNAHVDPRPVARGPRGVVLRESAGHRQLHPTGMRRNGARRRGARRRTPPTAPADRRGSPPTKAQRVGPRPVVCPITRAGPRDPAGVATFPRAAGGATGRSGRPRAAARARRGADRRRGGAEAASGA
jgi:hypothetical protein